MISRGFSFPSNYKQKIVNRIVSISYDQDRREGRRLYNLTRLSIIHSIKVPLLPKRKTSRNGITVFGRFFMVLIFLP